MEALEALELEGTWKEDQDSGSCASLFGRVGVWVRPLGIDFQLAIAVAIAIYCLSLWARRTHCLDRPRPAPDLSHPIPSYLILHCTTPPVRHIKFASPSLYVCNYFELN